MKILIYSDIHLDEWQEFSTPTLTFPTRLLEILQTGKWISSLVREHKPDYVVNCGDLLHRDHYITALTLAAASEFVKDIYAACLDVGATHVILPGNHDTFSKYVCSLSIFSGFAQVVYAPILTNDILGFIPFIRDESEFDKEFEKLVKNGAKIFFIHQDVQGSQLTGSKIQKIGFNPSLWEDFHVFCGHIHCFQSIKSTMVVGSSMFHHFGDTRNDRGCHLIEFTNYEVYPFHHKFIRNYVTPIFLTERIHHVEDLDYICNLNQFQDRYARTYLRLIVRQNVEDKVRKFLEEKKDVFRGVRLEIERVKMEDCGRIPEIIQDNSIQNNMYKFFDTKNEDFDGLERSELEETLHEVLSIAD